MFFAGPVFDAQDSIELQLQLTEADLYPRYNVYEALLNTPNRPLANLNQVVPLMDQTFTMSSQYVNATIQMQVVDMY